MRWIDKRREKMKAGLPAYVNSYAETCPYCQKPNSVTYGGMDVLGLAIYRKAKCRRCKEEWQVAYHLAGILDDCGDVYYLQGDEDELQPT